MQIYLPLSSTPHTSTGKGIRKPISKVPCSHLLAKFFNHAMFTGITKHHAMFCNEGEKIKIDLFPLIIIEFCVTII